MGLDQNHSLNRLMDDDPDQPTLVDRIKATVLEKGMTLANKKYGAWVKVAAGSMTGWLSNVAFASFVAYIAKYGVELTQDQVNTCYNLINSMQEMFVVLGNVLVIGIIHAVERRTKIKLQIAVGAKPDGWIGPGTVEAAEDITPKEIRRGIAIDQAKP